MAHGPGNYAWLMAVLRRLELWLVIIVTVVSACSQPAPTEAGMAATGVEAAEEDVDAEPTDEPSEEAEPEPGQEVVDAALAAGEPIVLWFWGAH